jgi:hypothetical protein
MPIGSVESYSSFDEIAHPGNAGQVITIRCQVAGRHVTSGSFVEDRITPKRSTITTTAEIFPSRSSRREYRVFSLVSNHYLFRKPHD